MGKNSGSLALAISIENVGKIAARSQSRSGFRIVRETCAGELSKIDGKWGSEGERFPKRAPNRRILATPREPLNDISEIARGNIRPVDLASWVSQRATTSRVTIWVGWVRKIGARGDIPFTLIASKRLFTFSFSRTKSNGLLDYGIARKFSSYLSSYLDADNVGRQCFQQHYGFSSYCFHPVEQSFCHAMLLRFFEEETIWRNSVLCWQTSGKGKVEKSWCSRNVNRVDPKEWWNVADYTMRLRERKRLPRKKTVCQFQFRCNPLRIRYPKEEGYSDFTLICTNFQKISSNGLINRCGFNTMSY